MEGSMKVKRVHVHEQVFDYMREAIKNKQWAVGEKIPPEVELSEMFGVNRLTVRMAIQKLSGMGLVETRQGDGTYVKQFSFPAYMNQISDFYMTPKLLDDVFEFRKTFEIACALSAMENATDSEFDKLWELCQTFETTKHELARGYSEEVFQRLLEQDIAFHFQICRMSHNDLFSYVFEVAREPVKQYFNVILKKRVDRWTSDNIDVTSWKDLHRVIFDAIKAKDVEQCKNAFLRMLDREVEIK